ncbi:DUF6325 family protein [Streptomyces mangrovisoli]|uniref:DUF1269 domain-containing family protein n=1 Tax=Streptomyces mangrovisoli TaxID=1428628 RepID=A0A1J4P3W2_9ACTN|nr:DUF6325 family protein [Streptomyces mangrovisoli]OIJ68906.1 hypothetical protein WN71_005455 [Streptomyces mangrovisoli]
MSTMGPVDLVILSFPAQRPPQSFLAALELVERRKDVRILDALIVTKSPTGEVGRVELSDIEHLGDMAAELAARRTLGMLGIDDIHEISTVMDPDTTVLALLVENVWAREALEEARKHDGRMLATLRIPYEQIAEVEAELAASAKATRR